MSHRIRTVSRRPGKEALVLPSPVPGRQSSEGPTKRCTLPAVGTLPVTLPGLRTAGSALSSPVGDPDTGAIAVAVSPRRRPPLPVGVGERVGPGRRVSVPGERLRTDTRRPGRSLGSARSRCRPRHGGVDGPRGPPTARRLPERAVAPVSSRRRPDGTALRHALQDKFDCIISIKSDKLYVGWVTHEML